MHPTDGASLWPDQQLAAHRQVRRPPVSFTCASMDKTAKHVHNTRITTPNRTSNRLLCPNRTYVADVQMDMDYNDDPENLPHTYSAPFNPFKQSECRCLQPHKEPRPPHHPGTHLGQRSQTDWIQLTTVISLWLLLKQTGGWKVLKWRVDCGQWSQQHCSPGKDTGCSKKSSKCGSSVDWKPVSPQRNKHKQATYSTHTQLHIQQWCKSFGCQFTGTCVTLDTDASEIESLCPFDHFDFKTQTFASMPITPVAKWKTPNNL